MATRTEAALKWLDDDQFVDVESDLFVLNLDYDGVGLSQWYEHDYFDPSRCRRFLAVVDTGKEPELATADDLPTLLAYFDKWFIYSESWGGPNGLASAEGVQIIDLDTGQVVPYTPKTEPSADLLKEQ